MAAFKVAEPGRGDAVAGDEACALDQLFHRRRVEPHAAAFFRQRERRTLRIARMLRRGLQHGEAHFGPVIGREPVGDQRRQQDIGLAKLLDDLGFHDRAP